VSYPFFILIYMSAASIEQAVELLEKENANLQPELLTTERARELMAAYARAEKLVAFGLAALSRKLDPTEVAKLTGSPIGKARNVVATGAAMAHSQELSSALQQGDISLDQATEIASAEESAPGAARELVAVAQERPFHVLKDRARKTKLEAEQHRDLFARQHAARSARSHTDELGMVHIHLALEPHVGAPIVSRAEAEAQRLARRAKRTEGQEPFERHLADAYAGMLSGSATGRAPRPELVVLVSYEVAKRGLDRRAGGRDVQDPRGRSGFPHIAKEIASDAFLSGVFYDGVDLRNYVRWSRTIPIGVRIALELGEPPSFDGIVCADCGNRFRTEFDHVKPRVALGPTSQLNLKPRCWRCHQDKTARDRKAGRLKPPDP
jgi:HNH endonuclease